jgi:hypothetical protein
MKEIHVTAAVAVIDIRTNGCIEWNNNDGKTLDEMKRK